MSLSQAEMTTTVRLGRQSQGHTMVAGTRNSACFDNSTTDFGLQTSFSPARYWMEAHLLPLDG